MKFSPKLLMLTLLFFVLTGLTPQPKPQKVQYHGFVVYWNSETRIADHCWYSLTKRQLSIPKVGRCNFAEDPKLNDIELKEYVGSGYDRGHLVPSADMEWSTTSCRDAFYMSNMAPQYPSFNRGEWKSLEMKVRELAKTEDSIIVMVGPIWDKPVKQSMDKTLPIPTRFFKVVWAPKSGKKWAWVMPHIKQVKPYETYACNQDSLLNVMKLTIKPH
jgi:endonuclease G